MTIPKYCGSSTRKPPAKRTLPGADTSVVLSVLNIVDDYSVQSLLSVVSSTKDSEGAVFYSFFFSLGYDLYFLV